MRIYVLLQPDKTKTVEDDGVVFFHRDLSSDGLRGMHAAVRTLYPDPNEAFAHVQFSIAGPLDTIIARLGRSKKPADLAWCEISDLLDWKTFVIEEGRRGNDPTLPYKYSIGTTYGHYAYNSEDFMTGFKAVLTMFEECPDVFLTTSVIVKEK